MLGFLFGGGGVILMPEGKSYSARISAWAVCEDMILCYPKATTKQTETTVNSEAENNRSLLVIHGLISLIKYQEGKTLYFYLFIFILLIVDSIRGEGEISVRQDPLEFKFLSIPLCSR